MKKNLIIIRHGRTDWNVQRKIQGRNDSPLNQLGLKDASWCRDQLCNDNLDEIITSPLIRTMQTARIINESHHAAMSSDERIIERDYGELSGLNVEENRELIEKQYGRGFEKNEAIEKRINEFITQRIFPSTSQNILIVSHNIAIRFILKYFLLSNENRYIHHREINRLILDEQRLINCEKIWMDKDEVL